MRLAISLLAAAFVVAACGERAEQPVDEPYSAEASPDATGQPGYSENPTAWDQVQGEATGRGQAATGATDQGLNDLPAGDAGAWNQVEQPEEDEAP